MRARQITDGVTPPERSALTGRNLRGFRVQIKTRQVNLHTIYMHKARQTRAFLLTLLCGDASRRSLTTIHHAQNQHGKSIRHPGTLLCHAGKKESYPAHTGTIPPPPSPRTILSARTALSTSSATWSPAQTTHTVPTHRSGGRLPIICAACGRTATVACGFTAEGKTPLRFWVAQTARLYARNTG